MTLAPIVADRVRENVSRSVKVRAADGAADLRIALETVLGVLVPEVEGAVGACGAEGTVLWVETDGIDGVDVAGVAVVGVSLAMALEAEVFRVVLGIDILNRATTFDAANSESGMIGEAGDNARLPF